MICVMPEESIWNRKLFETSEKSKAIWRWITVAFMALILLIFECLALTSYANFSLISKHTEISGVLVFVITQLAAVGGIWAIVTYIKDRALSGVNSIYMAWLGCTHCIYFLGSPSKFERLSEEFYSSGYPVKFGVGVLFLCLSLMYLSLLTWSPKTIESWSNTQ